MLNCQRVNPLRVVDWKWQRAMGRYRSQQPGPSRTRDGADGASWIRRALQFWTAYSQATTEEAKLYVAEDHPDIFWAHYMAAVAEPHARYALQAYLLSGADNWQIGFELGQAPEVVEAYEQLFYNVREKLDHWGYIKAHVLRDSLQRGLMDRDYRHIWNTFAYHYGPHMLRAVMSKTVNPVRCASSDTLSAAFQDDAIATLKLLAAMAAKMTPLDYGTQLPIIEQFGKAVEVERTTDSEGRAQGQLMENIAAMLGAIPITVEGRSPRHANQKLDRGALARYDTTAVELTFQESMRVAAGDALPNGERLASMTISRTTAVATEGQQ